jgi:hypothetical protein
MFQLLSYLSRGQALPVFDLHKSLLNYTKIISLHCFLEKRLFIAQKLAKTAKNADIDPKFFIIGLKIFNGSPDFESIIRSPDFCLNQLIRTK